MDVNEEKVFFSLEEVPEGVVGDVVRIGSQYLFRIASGKASLASKTDWECSKCRAKWFRSKLYQTENHCPQCHRFVGFLQKEV